MWAAASAGGFTDVTAAVGLDVEGAAGKMGRLAAADLDGDGWPDLVLDRSRVFLSRPDPDSPLGRRFELLPDSGLTPPLAGTLTIFTDLDGDGALDAVISESVDIGAEGWEDHGRRTGWQRGCGDGTFEPRQPLPAPPRTTATIAAGDLNRDGRIDLFFGNGYVSYGVAYDGWPDDLLLNEPAGWVRQPLPGEQIPFDEASASPVDLGGRPTYGALMIEDPLGGAGPAVLVLSYGRRWNRLWRQTPLGLRDDAPALGLDGDAVRHGRYPDWLAQRAATDPRFDRPDEPPFRAGGNSFDAAAGDLDDDGDLDLLITEITHAWAGDSSDRSRVLFLEGGVYRERAGWSLDRVPPPPVDGAMPSWNQGDLFGALADLDNDGWLDVLLSSGDYPDDERLRVWRQSEGKLEEVSGAWGIDHDGSQQIALADFDRDGDLDIAAGQTFNRYPAEQREGREPHVALLRNDAAGASVVLELRGDGRSINREAIGAVAYAEVGDRTLRRDRLGPGGHAGKQPPGVLHIGLGDASQIDRLTIRWPDAVGSEQVFEDVAPGRYTLSPGGVLEPVTR